MLETDISDTAKCKILSDLIEFEDDINVWPKYNEDLRVKCKTFLDTCKTNHSDINVYKGYLALTLSNKGFLLEIQGDVENALDYFNQSLKIQEDISDQKGAATTLTNIAYIHQSRGDIQNALDTYLKGLKIQEKINDKKGIGASLVSIGYIYDRIDNEEKALEYYLKSLEIRKEVNDKSGIANSLNNIAVVYQAWGELEKALDYYNQSLKIREEINDARGIASSLNNIGDLYKVKNMNLKALEYYKKSLGIRQSLNDKYGIGASLNSIAIINLKNGDYKNAIKDAQKSLEIAQELGYVQSIKKASETLSVLYSKTYDWEQAYKMHIIFKQIGDSIINENNQKEGARKYFQYQYEKKATADSITYLKQKEINEAEIDKQKALLKVKENQQYALFGGIILVLVFSVFMYNRYRLTQQQKVIIEETNEELNQTNEELAAQRDEIEKQKHKVEEAHQEIKDSIKYAKRIQDAILPSLHQIKNSLPNSFVFYQPKDVVAGDFYWQETINNKVYIAAADCTGHGVPGAMVSVVCSNALTKVFLEDGISDVGKILDRTREIVIDKLAKSVDVKDGMDISLACFDFDNMKLEWAGANNPLYLLRNNELQINKGDREPIGYTENPTPFTKHIFDLEKEDIIYLFTDGYADQFGGESGKKLGYKNFRERLIEISNLEIDNQKIELESFFQEWKGHEEQVDDVCVVGIRI